MRVLRVIGAAGALLPSGTLTGRRRGAYGGSCRHTRHVALYLFTSTETLGPMQVLPALAQRHVAP